jgi:cell surface protein SprA
VYRWDLTRSLNFDFTATNKARIDEPYGELTKATKDSVRHNFFKGGRNTSYNQTIILSYTLPFSKLPATDWITSRLSYTAHYDWVASSLLAQQLNQGNILENGATKNLHGELDFNRLYGKSRWLRALDQQKVQPAKSTTPANPLDFAKERELLKKKMAALDSTQKAFKAKLAKMNKTDRKLARRQERERLRNERQAQPVEMGTTTRILGKLLTMVKRASVDYGEVYTSRIPGYLDSTKFFGNNFKSNAPGLGYILGKAPDDAFLDNFAKRGLLTSDSSFNLLFTQSYDQKLNFQATLEPFREFTVDLSLDKTFNKQFQELFKDTTGHSGFSHLSPYLTGGYSVSFISFQTLFEKYDPNEVSQTFLRFQNYRQQLSNRVANTNQYWKNNGSQVGSNGYALGYGQYSQDVLIPAFIAAYTNKSPNEAPLVDETSGKINTNPFHNIKPMPNWRLNFTGLSKVPALQKIFTAFTITHSYQSHLSMNSFQSALNYNDPLRVGAPQFIDTLSGNYVPYFVVPNLTVTEAFDPLLGIEFTTKDKLSGRFEYAKSRQLSLSLVDYQLSEVRSTGYTFGASWRKKGFPLPFKLPKILSAKGSKKLDNDVTFKLDFSIRDDITANSTLDQGSTTPTSGQKVVKISPSIDYILNSRINVKLFFDQQRVTPYVSSSAPTVNTRAGVALRISLAQ